MTEEIKYLMQEVEDLKRQRDDLSRGLANVKAKLMVATVRLTQAVHGKTPTDPETVLKRQSEPYRISQKLG